MEFPHILCYGGTLEELEEAPCLLLDDEVQESGISTGSGAHHACPLMLQTFPAQINQVFIF